MANGCSTVLNVDVYKLHKDIRNIIGNNDARSMVICVLMKESLQERLENEEMIELNFLGEGVLFLSAHEKH